MTELYVRVVIGNQGAADAHMTPEERMKVLNWLHESHKEFLAAIEDVTAEQWKPAPDCRRAPQSSTSVLIAICIS